MKRMNLQDNIKRMELELADMKKQLEQKEKLELKGGKGFNLNTYDTPKYFLGNSSVPMVSRGAFRATKELAEIADKNMVARNRLEAYVHQIQGDGEGRWLIYTWENGTYSKSNHKQYRPFLGTVYMQEETAEILCKALNAYEIEL